MPTERAHYRSIGKQVLRWPEGGLARLEMSGAVFAIFVIGNGRRRRCAPEIAPQSQP
jgi:hypothetical protein